MKGARVDASVVRLGPFRLLYSEKNDALYLQANQRATGRWKSVVRVSRDGNFHVTSDGVVSTDTLEEFGEVE